jgi:hypothetical protein
LTTEAVVEGADLEPTARFPLPEQPAQPAIFIKHPAWKAVQLEEGEVGEVGEVGKVGGVVVVVVPTFTVTLSLTGVEESD